MTEQDFYVHCIEKAVAFVVSEMRGDHTPSLADVAAAAGLSKFHFHRVYQLLTGETLFETITRLKLARGAGKLKDPGASVTDAAFEAGYGSSQAFAKVLKRVVDHSASQLRSDPERLAETLDVLSVPVAADSAVSENAQRALQVELASLEPFTAVAIRTHGRYPALNETYYQLFSAIGDPQNVQAILGQPLDDIDLVDDGDAEFLCALKLDPDVDIAGMELEQLDIAERNYLVTRHIGSYDGLPAALDRAYLTGMASTDLRLVDRPCLFHYLDDPEEVAERDLRTDVYLPIERC